MKVSILCPLYEAEQYLEGLEYRLHKQKDVEIAEVIYAYTESKDNTKKLLDQMGCEYITVEKNQFSHSLTREELSKVATGDILVFISQDVIMDREDWLYNLVNPIIKDEAQASFSRQLCTNNTIEKYIREKNYPKESRLVSKQDIDRLGFLTFFYSDASSACRKDVYETVNKYDQKDLIINEDMYLAYKLIMNGYKIKYCGDSEVIHSHTFTLEQLFKRYFDTGVFLKQNDYFLKYNSNDSGLALAKYVFKRALEDKNFKVLFNIIPNFASRFIGNNMGKRYLKLSDKSIMNLTSYKNYWNRRNKEEL